MRLKYEELPAELKEQYQSRDVHKAIKKTATLIQIHTRDRAKHNWWKRGQQWERNGHASEEQIDQP